MAKIGVIITNRRATPVENSAGGNAGSVVATPHKLKTV